MSGGGNAAGLVAMSEGCTFDNIKTLSTAYSGADYTWKPCVGLLELRLLNNVVLT